LVFEIDDSRKGYRSRLEILRDILLVTGDKGTKKTHIMYGANLSYRLLTQYLDDASNAGLIACDGESCYMITKKGKMFLELYEDYEKKSKEVEKRLNHLKNGKETLEKMLTP